MSVSFVEERYLYNYHFSSFSSFYSQFIIIIIIIIIMTVTAEEAAIVVAVMIGSVVVMEVVLIPTAVVALVKLLSKSWPGIYACIRLVVTLVSTTGRYVE